MHSNHIRPTIRRAWALTVIAAVLSVVGVAAAALPAQAHAELIGSSPKAGATEQKPPKVVALQFSEIVLELGATVQVTGPDGRVDDGRPRLAGAAVVQPLKAELPAGAYRVVWRVTSDDGHPIEGTYDFDLATGTTPSGTATSPTTGSTSPAATVVATVTSGTGADQGATGGPSKGWLYAGVGIVVAGLLAASLALRRRSGATPPTP